MISSSVRLALAIVLLGLLAGAASALDEEALDSLKDEFNAEPRAVREAFLSDLAYSVVTDDAVYHCDVPLVLYRLGAAGERFRMRDVDVDDTRVLVKVETTGEREVELSVHAAGKVTQAFLDEVVPRLVRDIFAVGAVAPRRVVGHRESGLYHRGRCDHRPPAELREAFADTAVAAAAGYEPCRICYALPPALPWPGYRTLRSHALAGLDHMKALYPPSTSAEARARLTRLGEELLATWPLTLTGHAYRFELLSTDRLVLGSFPTGVVVLSEGLLGMLEGDAELQFLLAREIAACEVLLPPRAAQDVVGGGVPSAPSVIPVTGNHVADLVNMMNSIGHTEDTLDRVRWRTQQELLPDVLAVHWLAGREDGEARLAHARSALAKLRRIGGGHDPSGYGAWRKKHARARDLLLDPSRYRALPAREVFRGLDDEDDVRSEVRVLGIRRTEDRSEVLLLLTMTDHQEKRFHMGGRGQVDGKVTDAAGETFELVFQDSWGAPGRTTLWFAELRWNGFDDLASGAPRELEIWRLSGDIRRDATDRP